MIAILKNRRSPFYLATTFLILLLFALFASTLAFIFSGVLILILLIHPLLLNWIGKLYGQEDIADEVYFAKTKDGWNLALHRHIPPQPDPRLAPVLVVHGIATNKFVVDLDKRHSLPYYLKLRGYDVFAVSLRGCGRSYHDSPTRYEDFTFDDIVKYDVPAMIDKVKRIANSDRVSYVGHSMGAMIVYSHFCMQEAEDVKDIAAFVSLGGPGNLNHIGITLIGLLSRFPRARKMLDLKFGASILAPLAGELYTPVDEILYNPKVTSPKTVKKIMKNAIENIADGVTEQFMRWIETKRMVSLNGFFDYEKLQQKITAPSLFIAGEKDVIATPDSVRSVFERAGSKKKEFRIVSKASGSSDDYGHACLVMGDRAEDDVFQYVESFLRKHGTRSSVGVLGKLGEGIRRFFSKRRR
ncbi:alpha/beta fold hydrolase [Leptospira gomenensis]|uniref:Alpha/beta fold hydrolase n=1 Tax=Leptospira gomenensis TaxID=2484974 RepID=A0A5F1YAR1_9LEPT|nr:alpha/beta fold hydrolase [Leptospira gomenensis]TGK34482.1 alpha/beta fold hydrolase [Leptospira gomenensis]TGK40208.1 alpha/beta fold hydrolase [Leptospira gomenensis]TGK44805.1 alpha/beta fold hydrolase [Leptospira gomenensis]TGK55717.1 alpha/beta fold hydrolase [Leptospira gomenensis]